MIFLLVLVLLILYINIAEIKEGAKSQYLIISSLKIKRDAKGMYSKNHLMFFCVALKNTDIASIKYKMDIPWNTGNVTVSPTNFDGIIKNSDAINILNFDFVYLSVKFINNKEANA